MKFGSVLSNLGADRLLDGVRALSFSRAVSLALGGRPNDAARLLRFVLKTRPPRSIDERASYILGSILAVQGDFDGADAAFSRHAGLLPWASNGSMANIRFNRSAHSADDIPLPRALSGFDQPIKDSAFVYFVSCDSRYASLFARPLCESLRQNAPGGLLHLHVINPAPDAERLIGELERGDDAVMITREVVDLQSLDALGRRSYYACSRFLLVPDLLRRYARPMIVADADQLVIGPLHHLFERGSDLNMIRFDHGVVNFFSLLSASVIVAQPTDRAVRYFDDVRRYIVDLFDGAAPVGWHADQIALAVSLLRNKEIKFDPLPTAAMHSGGADDVPPEETVFWSITYSIERNHKKLSAERFRKWSNPA